MPQKIRNDVFSFLIQNLHMVYDIAECLHRKMIVSKLIYEDRFRRKSLKCLSAVCSAHQCSFHVGSACVSFCSNEPQQQTCGRHHLILR